MSNVTLIGIDTAKSVFHLYAVDKDGKMVYKKKLSRNDLLSTLAQIPPCVIAFETCSASQHWARKCRELGHEVRLTPIFTAPLSVIINPKNSPS